MCGIAGVFRLDGAPLDIGLMERMTQVIKHRGPDDEGYLVVNTREKSYEVAGGRDTPDAVWGSPYPFCPKHKIDAIVSPTKSFDLALGHRRLSIIDLSPAGHQPMCNEDGTVWVIHNGEIYNYIELREELKSKGYRFKSNTDTEVIIHAYEEWGYDCLQRFNGDWSFAIWDMSSNKLFCSRDRFGIKPFYYYFNNNLFVFGSEIKALLQHPEVPKKVNEEAVHDYLVWGQLGYTDDTFFKGVKQLSPSHYLVVDAKGGLDIKKWWTLEVNPDLGDFSGGDVDDMVSHFLALLEDAVRLRLTSDVPVGTCLSGGVDSSSIVCLVNKLIVGEEIIDRRLIGDRQKTFSSCFEDKLIDERQFIETALRKTGAEGNYVFPDGHEFWEELPRLVWHQDEPFGGSSIYAQWTVMRKAKSRGVKVLLDGQGGDELLAGYHPYYGTFLIDLALKGKILRLLAEAKDVSAIIGVRNLGSLTSTALGIALYGGMPLSVQLAIKNSVLSLRGTTTNNVLNPSFSKQFSRHGLATFREYSKPITSLQQCLHRDVSAAITHLLRYEDRDSMAFSVEARVPFLDYRLVEYVFSLPATLKIRNGWTKWILRQAMRGILPEEIRFRRDKLGFPTPERTWLWQNKNGIEALFGAENVLSGEFINPGFIRDNLDGLLSQGGHSVEIWKYINLELWLQAFFGDDRMRIQ